MNNTFITTIAALAAAASAFGQANLVAGWDFSQYAGVNFNVVNGTTGAFVNTLSANYSDYDPTLGAGAESAAFGTMYWNGSFGSTNGQATNPGADAIPFSGSLTNNTFMGSGVAADSHTIMDAEGFDFSNFLSFTVLDSFGGGDGDLVFGATTPWDNQDWELRFAGTVNGVGADASVGILFSTDGVTYNPVGSALLTDVDTLYTFTVPGNVSSTGYFMFDFTDIDATANPVIDNVGISAVPEPATYALYLGALAFLFIVRRRLS